MQDASNTNQDNSYNNAAAPSLTVEQAQRQLLISTLAKSKLEDIQRVWNKSIVAVDYEFIRQPEVGMVMAVGRTGMTGEPFNLGEVTVTRCAVKLANGETGFGYVNGRNKEHSTHIAVIDALAQNSSESEEIYTQVIYPLEKIYQKNAQEQDEHANKTKVDFFTLVRGENE